MSPCVEFGFPGGGWGFEKARQAWAGCGCVARSSILVYAQARETRRRPKIAAAFCEPNSITLPGEQHNIGGHRRKIVLCTLQASVLEFQDTVAQAGHGDIVRHQDERPPLAAGERK